MATGSRILWKGAISFGLVHIPVSLHTATADHGIDFDWLDTRSMDPVGYKRVNKRRCIGAQVVDAVDVSWLVPDVVVRIDSCQMAKPTWGRTSAWRRTASMQCASSVASVFRNLRRAGVA